MTEKTKTESDGSLSKEKQLNEPLGEDSQNDNWRKDKSNVKKRKKKNKHMFAISKWLKGNNRTSSSSLTNPSILQKKKNVGFVDQQDNISSSSCSSSSSSSAVPEALDGGYGWIIVFSSFLIHFICDGISFSFGVMFPELQTYFKASKFLASIPGSVFLSIPLLGGPIAAVITDVYDCRNVTIAGGLIASAGVFLSYFCNNIATFTITYGIIGGSGLCLCFNTAIVIVTYYFEKKRALATALACCGTGAGTIINPPVMEYLISTFGWSKFLLFQAVWLLGLVFCGLIMKDVSWPQDTQEYKEKKFLKRMEKNRLRREKEEEYIQGQFPKISSSNSYSYLKCRFAHSLPEIPTHIKNKLKNMEYSSSNHCLTEMNPDNTRTDKETAPFRSKSYGYFTREKRFRTESERENDVLKRIESTVLEIENNQNLNHLSLECGSIGNGKHHKKNKNKITTSLNALDLDTNDSDDEAGLTLGVSLSLSETESSSSEDCSNISIDGESREEKSYFESESSPMINAQKIKSFKNRVSLTAPSTNFDDIFSPRDAFLAAQSNPKMEKTRMTSLISATLTSTHGRVPATNAMIACGHRHNRIAFEDSFKLDRVPSAPNIYFRRRRKYQKGVLKIKRIYGFMKDTAIENWELIKIGQFRVFLLSVFILYMFFDIPYVNLPEYAVEKLGVSENQSSLLISSIGFFNMVFMLLLGMISDWKYTRSKVLQIYGLFVVAAGIAVVFASLTTNYISLIIYVSLFGGFISANYVLASVLTVDLLSFHCFQSGYGLLNLAQGFGNFIGPSFVGFMYDQTGSYQIIFYIGSCGIILSGLIVLSLYYIKRKNARNSKKTHFADPLVEHEEKV